MKTILIIAAAVFAFATTPAYTQLGPGPVMDEVLKMMCGIDSSKPACKQAVEDKKKPEVRLYKMYENYVIIQGCYDIRKGFEQVYINDVQREEARRIASTINEKLNLSNYKEIWDKANTAAVAWNSLIQNSKVTKDAVGMTPFQYCQMAYRHLQEKYQEEFPENTRKKDF